MFETDYRKQAIEYLANSIKANNAVAFIGSGLSQLAGVKSWMQLLEDLKSRLHANAAIISAIDKAIEQGRFLNAATMIREIMEDDRFEKEIQSLIDDTTEPQPEHKVLMELGFRAVITTNYDTLLERSLERIDSLSYYESSDISKFIHDRRPFIFHLHGIINRPGKIILDWSKYNELLVPNLSIRFLGTLLETSEILWIGYSHSDPDLNLVMAQQSYLRLPGGYQLVFEDDYELAIMCKNRGIKPVRISRTDRNNDVLCFLRELQDEIGSLREREDADLLNAYSTIITDSFSGLTPKLPPKILDLIILLEDGSDEILVTEKDEYLFSMETKED